MARLTVALVFGGRSGEHAVSLRSAASVAEGLASRHEVLPLLVTREGEWRLQPGPQPLAEGGVPVFLAPFPSEAGRLRRLSDAAVVAQPDVYFPVLHGPFGEDGTIQGLFELASVAYVGAGVLASAAGMDKATMKALFAHAGLPQVDYRVLRGREPEALAGALEALGLPVFVKPANLGSSVAVAKAKRREELEPALEAAFAYDSKVLIEAAARSPREIEVSVLGDESAAEASLPGEIVPDREFYDYDAKYSEASRSELRIPAPLEAETVEHVRALGRAAFQAIGASGYARVDFFLEPEGRLLVNEINTIPGFTSISMFPKLWQASGLPYPELLERLVGIARRRRAEHAALATSFR